MQTKNVSLFKNYFTRLSSSRDRRSAWLIWPAFFVKKHYPDLEVKQLHMTLGWAQYRFCVILGHFQPLPETLTSDHQESIDNFLKWTKSVFGKVWTRLDVEKLFIAKPEWQRLIIMAKADHHYTRVLLAREIIGLKEHHPLRSSSGILDQRENEIFRTKEKKESQRQHQEETEEEMSTESFQTTFQTTSKTGMEDLDRLEKSIRGNH